MYNLTLSAYIHILLNLTRFCNSVDSSDDDKESRASRSSLTTSPVTILEGYPCNKDLEKDSHQCQVISTPYLPKKPGPIDDVRNTDVCKS